MSATIDTRLFVSGNSEDVDVSGHDGQTTAAILYPPHLS
jgi:hypothetical protein